MLSFTLEDLDQVASNRVFRLWMILTGLLGTLEHVLRL